MSGPACLYVYSFCLILQNHGLCSHIPSHIVQSVLVLWLLSQFSVKASIPGQIIGPRQSMAGYTYSTEGDICLKIIMLEPVSTLYLYIPAHV